MGKLRRTGVDKSNRHANVHHSAGLLRACAAAARSAAAMARRGMVGKLPGVGLVQEMRSEKYTCRNQ